MNSKELFIYANQVIIDQLQIIKEELEAVLNEALPLETMLADARVMDPDQLQTMPELKDLAQGEDMRYHRIISSHAGLRLVSIFAKVNGKVYEVANKQPIEQTSLIEDDLIANGFKDQGFNLHLAGVQVFGERFETLSKRDQAWINPTMALIMLAILFFTFRSVGGMVARDQFVGPFQVPVSDYSLSLRAFTSNKGEAVTIGEKPTIALINPEASMRMALGEALTNMSGVVITGLNNVQVSANWMAASGENSDDLALRSGVEALSKIAIDLKVSIPVGKDSLSMRTKWSEKSTDFEVSSPLSGIVTAMAPVEDVTDSVTPELNLNENTCLVLIKLEDKNRLAGSIFSEVTQSTYKHTPDIENIDKFKNLFNTIQNLVKNKKILAMHDISDGGLIACLAEMIISGNSGFDLKTKLSKKDLQDFLFSEELGFVMQVSKETFNEIEDFMKAIKADEMLTILGNTNEKNGLTISSSEFNETINLETLISNWTHVSTKIKSLRDNISLVSQDTTLFDDTVRNNILYANPEANDEDVDKATELSFAKDFIEKLPKKYDTIIGENGVTLSGGEKQRLSIARAMLKKSSIILLDEATSSLDAETENKIQQAISFLTKGRTTIVIAHRLSTVENAENIIVLKNGEIVENGSHEELMSLENSYYDLYKNQFKDEVEPPKKGYISHNAQFNLSEFQTSNFVEEAWYENKSWIKIFLPLSWIYRFLFKIFRNRAIASSWKPDIKTIVIGNITVGGTGKTPLTIWLTNELKKQGYRPGIVSRGYKGSAKNYPMQIDYSSSASEVGDEPMIIFKNTLSPVVVGPDRVESAKFLISKNNCDILLSDDGLQHFRLGRDVEIAMIDGIRKFGNNHLLPAGPLREPIKKLEQVDFVINTNNFYTSEAEKLENNFLMTYKPVKWVSLQSLKSIDINDWSKDRIVYGIAGIGNPSSFFSLLRSLGFQVIEKIFPDHHEFVDTDFNEMNDLPIIMTEKDAIKCSFLNHTNYWYLKIEAEVSDNFEQDFLAEIKAK